MLRFLNQSQPCETPAILLYIFITQSHGVYGRCASQVLYDKEVLALKAIGVDLAQHLCVPEGFEQQDPRTWVFTHEDDNHKNKCLMNRVGASSTGMTLPALEI
jgi:hypothetical protein